MLSSNLIDNIEISSSCNTFTAVTSTTTTTTTTTITPSSPPICCNHIGTPSSDTPPIDPSSISTEEPIAVSLSGALSPSCVCFTTDSSSSTHSRISTDLETSIQCNHHKKEQRQKQDDKYNSDTVPDDFNANHSSSNTTGLLDIRSTCVSSSLSLSSAATTRPYHYHHHNNNKNNNISSNVSCNASSSSLVLASSNTITTAIEPVTRTSTASDNLYHLPINRTLSSSSSSSQLENRNENGSTPSPSPSSPSHPHQDRLGTFSSSTQTLDNCRRSRSRRIGNLSLKRGFETTTATLISRLRRAPFEEESSASTSTRGQPMLMSHSASSTLTMPNDSSLMMNNVTSMSTGSNDKMPMKKTSRVKAMFSKLRPKTRRGQTAVASSNTANVAANSLGSALSTTALDLDSTHHRMSMSSTVSVSGSDIVIAQSRNSMEQPTVTFHVDHIETSTTSTTTTTTPAAADVPVTTTSVDTALPIPHAKLPTTMTSTTYPSEQACTVVDATSPGIDDNQHITINATSSNSNSTDNDNSNRLCVPNTPFPLVGVDLSVARSESPLKSEFANNGVDIYSDEDDEEDMCDQAVSLAAAAAIAASVAATASTVVAEATSRKPPTLVLDKAHERKPTANTHINVLSTSNATTTATNNITPSVQINGTACFTQASNNFAATCNDTSLAATSRTSPTSNVPTPLLLNRSLTRINCTSSATVSASSPLNRSLLDGNIGRILVSEHVYGRLVERGGAMLVKLLDVHVVWNASPPFNPSFDIMWPFPFTDQQINQYGDASNGQNITPESLQELRGDATIARVIYAMTLERDRRMLVSSLCVRDRFVSTYDLLRLLVLRYLEPFCQPSLNNQLNSDDDDGLSDDSQYRGGSFRQRSFGGLYEPGTGLDAVRVFDTWLRDFPDDFTGKMSHLDEQQRLNVVHCHQLATIWMELVGQLDGIRGAQVAASVQDRLRSCYASDGSSTLSSPISPTSNDGDGDDNDVNNRSRLPLNAADNMETSSYSEERHVRDANRISLENILDIAQPSLNEIFIMEKGGAWLKERQSKELTTLLKLQPLPSQESIKVEETTSNGNTTYEEDPQFGEDAYDYAGTDLNRESPESITTSSGAHQSNGPQLSHQMINTLPDNALVWPFIVYTPRTTDLRASRAVTLPAVLADLVWSRESGADRLQKFVGAAPYLFHEDDIARIIVLLYLEALYMRDTSGADTTIARLRLVNLIRKWVEQRTLGTHACSLVDTLLRVVVTRDPDTATFAYPVLDKLHKTGTALLEVSNHEHTSTAESTGPVSSSTANAANAAAAATTTAIEETATGSTELTVPQSAIAPQPAMVITPDSNAFPIRTASALAYRLLHADPEQLAARLVRLDHAQFIAIPLRDLIPPAKGQPRPTSLERHAHWFDALAYNTAAAILAPDNIGHRADVLERVIVLAGACLKHRSFNAAFALRATLSLSAIERLHATWNMLPAPVLRIMSQLEHACSTNDNYAHYRMELRRAEGKPAVPYIGLCLSDMMRLHEGAQVSAALPLASTAVSLSNSLQGGPSSPTSPTMSRVESGERFVNSGAFNRRRTSITESVKAWMTSNLITDTDETRPDMAGAAHHPAEASSAITTTTATTTSSSTPVYGKEDSGEGPMIRWQYWKRVGIQIERLRGWQHISYRNIGENTPAASTVPSHGHSHSMDGGRLPFTPTAAATTTAAAATPSSTIMPVRPQRPRANTTPNDGIRELQQQQHQVSNAARVESRPYGSLRQRDQRQQRPSHTSNGSSGERHAPTEWRWRWLTDLLCNAQRSPSPEQLYARSQTVEPTIRRESASSVLANILPMTSSSS